MTERTLSRQVDKFDGSFCLQQSLNQLYKFWSDRWFPGLTSGHLRWLLWHIPFSARAAAEVPAPHSNIRSQYRFHSPQKEYYAAYPCSFGSVISYGPVIDLWSTLSGLPNLSLCARAPSSNSPPVICQHAELAPLINCSSWKLYDDFPSGRLPIGELDFRHEVPTLFRNWLWWLARIALFLSVLT